mmetsp:Transcript_28431/g.71923  ORF Transcript_28431/g.71923 Transcript_28431/m.71923 type:complete len:814 (-) Transcript_28431:63-2504(-)
MTVRCAWRLAAAVCTAALHSSIIPQGLVVAETRNVEADWHHRKQFRQKQTRLSQNFKGQQRFLENCSSWGDSACDNFHSVEWIKRRPEMPPLNEVDACNGEWTDLFMQAVEIVNPLTGTKTWTRAYNGGVPGPTFRVKQGCTWKLRIHNELGPNSVDCNATGLMSNQPRGTNGSYCFLNSTNIHTHGMHMSGIAPGDSIFTRLGPGNTGEWYFEIPANHLGGTHWYHPHLHHATSAQVGGGAAGMIIVEDPEGSVPPYVAAMPEKHLVFMAIDWTLQSSIEDLGGGKLWQTDPFESIPLLVNGVSQPKVTIKPATWYRFRMVFGAVETVLQMVESGPAFCSVKLLAKDGVWLNVAPRDLKNESGVMTPIQLSPGNRADIAIACVCRSPDLGCYTEFYSVQNCTSDALSEKISDHEVRGYNQGYGTPDYYTPCKVESHRRRRGCEGIPDTPFVETWGPLIPPQCGFGRQASDETEGKFVDGPGLGSPDENTFHGANRHRLAHGLTDVINGTIFTVVVEASKDGSTRKYWPPAWQFKVRRPCYLVETRDLPVNTSNQKHVEFFGAVYPDPGGLSEAGPIAAFWDDGLHKSDIPPHYPHFAPHWSDDTKFADPPAPDPYGSPIPVGTLSEWDVGGMYFHPFHLHITPWQLINTSAKLDEWTQIGDWQDTMIAAHDITSGQAGQIYMRFWTDQFVGPYMAHCHLLTHEDEGMMFYVNVTGTPPPFPPHARENDPTCYAGHLKDASGGGWGFEYVLPWDYDEPYDEPRKSRSLRSTMLHQQLADDEVVFLQTEVEGPWGEEEEEKEYGESAAERGGEL